VSSFVLCGLLDCAGLYQLRNHCTDGPAGMPGIEPAGKGDVRPFRHGVGYGIYGSDGLIIID